MAFSKSDTFVARRSFITYDSSGVIPVQFDKGSEYKCNALGELVDVITAEIYNITNHVAARWEWYFDKKNSFNPSRTVPVRVEYVREILRAADGFDMEELFAIAEDENFGPLESPLSKNNFSRVLTDVCSSVDFGMRDKDGEWVTGVGHNKKGCTFHKKDKKVA